jgi:hypothetical protein
MNAPSRTRLRTEVLWFVGALLWWALPAIAGFAWLLSQLMAI